MDALTLANSIPTQASVKGGGVSDAIPADPAQAGGLATEDLFAALLAQQMGIALPQLSDDPESDGFDLAAGKVDADLLLAKQQPDLPAPVLLDVTPNQQVIPADVAIPLVAGQAVTVDEFPAPMGGRSITRADRSPVAMQLLTGTREVAPLQRQTVAIEAAAFAGDVQSLVPEPDHNTALPLLFNGQPRVVATTSPVAVQSVGVIPQEVSSPSWGNLLGDRVVWMIGQNIKAAEIHLNPPSLGPLEVRLNMVDGQANLTFTTQHMPVREALEAATPRLREMMGESGISLGGVSVNVGSFSQQGSGAQQDNGRPAMAWANSGEQGADFVTMVSPGFGREGNGMVDLFA